MFFMIIIYVVIHISATQSQSNSSCLTPNNEEGTCKSVLLCKPFVDVAPTADNTTWDFIEKSQCGPLKVCCGTLATYNTTSNKNENVELSNDQNRNAPSNWRPVAPRTICGQQHVGYRTYSGKQTAVDEYPWIALLGTKSNDGTFKQLCLGVVISRRYLLTSAFCTTFIERGINVTVRLGEFDLYNKTDCNYGEYMTDCADDLVEVGVESSIKHPSYRWPLQDNIGLVRLDQNIQFTDYVRAICLPSDGGDSKVDDKVRISGWGFSKVDDKFFENREKKRTTHKVMKNVECETFWKSNRFVKLNNNTYCTTEVETNLDYPSCYGDRGGPVMLQYSTDSWNKLWQVDGIIAFEECGTVKIVTKVSNYIDWIINNIRP